ncbi:MAG: amidohydrolase family protein [Muribaculaceae bacterium]|nr:amidohydrolase family protein [Muribaculaceae bacterium]
MKTLLIHNALIADSAAPYRGYVLCSEGVTALKGTGDAPAELLAQATEVVDAQGGYLIPGLIDTHVHFREPGLEYKATVLSESRAAAAGGVTAVFDMPNTKPATTSAATLAEKMDAARRKGSYTRYMPLMGIIPGGLKELRKLDPALVPAVKLFLGTSTGAMASPESGELAEVFRYCADIGLPIIVHAEDNDIIAANTAAAIARYGSAEAVPVSIHPEIRSREACLRSSAAAVELAERFGTRLHIAHVSTADEVRELLSEGPSDTKLITAETTPLYLDPVLAESSARSSLHKVNPAIKTPADAEALRQALISGAIDTIGTDHAPHLLSEKRLPGITAMSGAPSIQFALPLMLSYLPLPLVVRKMTEGPRKVFGLRCGRLDIGSPADMALVREVDPYTISDANVLSTCGWTPFAGREVRHRVERTWVAGALTHSTDGKGNKAADIEIRKTKEHDR